MSANSVPVQRYKRGGDIYARVAADYGVPAADRLASAAASGRPHAINDTLAEIRSGPRLNDNVWSILGTQLVTDPLAAPLESANNQIGNAVLGVLKNPWVLFAIVLIVFVQLDGVAWLRRNFAK